LRDHAFVLVAASRTRPEGAEASLGALAARLGPRAVVELELGPLPPKVLTRVARALAPDASDADHERIVLRAGGMPGHVAELARSLDDPDRALPATSASLLWARLGRLEPEGRRVLRAASLVGRRAEPPLLSALLGQAEVTPALLAELEHLVARGFLRAIGAGPTERTFELAGEQVRAACDALLTDDDRVFGHGVAAEWLAAHGGDAWQIAHHFVGARQPERAAPYFLRAARLALAGEDRTSLDRLVEEGRAATTDAELRGELDALAAEGAYWAGDVATAFATALRATDELRAGSASWFRSASIAITAGGQLGKNDVVRALLDRAMREADAGLGSTDAIDARVVCVARAVTQLGAAGVGVDDARTLLTRALAAGTLGPAARAWAHRASVDARRLHFDEAIGAWVRAHEAHLEARDQRGAAQVLLYLGSYYCWTGAWARAAEVVDDADRIARRLGAAYLETWALYVRGKLLVETAPAAVALDALRTVVERAKDSPRIRAGAELYRSLAAMRAGEPERAERFAREALAVPGVSALR
ncbi:hypothetical protein L6R52_44290, partial [Myxococcota bacterium]|nr:hypothetical protein [Myxococcota bacterium]